MTWIQTRSGKAFDFTPEGLKRSEIDILDIVSSLSKQCRFVGHCPQFYSVAEHCVLASYVPTLTTYGAWCALLHDAHEAYVGDVSSPLKSLLPDYQRIERAVETKLQQWFAHQYDATIKEIDVRMLVTEKRVLAGNYWHLLSEDLRRVEPYFDIQSQIQCWPHTRAYTEFIERFDELEQLLFKERVLTFDHQTGYSKINEDTPTQHVSI